MKKTSLKSVKRLNPYRGKVSVRGHRNHKGESMLQEPAPARAPKRHPSYSSDTRKLTRRHMDAVPHGPNESKRADTTPAQGVDHVPVCPGSASTETSAGSHPLTSSPQLLSVERGRQWKSLVEQGESLSKLARRAGCSKSQARDLVMLGSLPEDLEQGYLQGKLGRKKVLALARTRRKPVQEMQATDSGMQSQAAQSSGPAMTESQRQGEIDKYAKLVTDWVRSTNLVPATGSHFSIKWYSPCMVRCPGCIRNMLHVAMKSGLIRIVCMSSNAVSPKWKLSSLCLTSSTSM